MASQPDTAATTVRKLPTVKELPLDERPREKMALRGAGELSNADLLAILLNTGTRGEPVTSLAQRILLEQGGLRGLRGQDFHGLMKIHGLGEAKAAKVLAALELGRRMSALTTEDRVQIRTPEDLANCFVPHLSGLEREELWIVALDTKHQIKRLERVYRGTVNSANVRIAEVFTAAVRAEAPAIAIAHNHPSGDPMPSAADVSLTAELVAAAKLLDIDLMDHLVIGDGRWVSLKRMGLGFPLH